MNIIFVGKFRGKPVRCQIGHGWQKLLCGGAFAGAIALFLCAGYWWGFSSHEAQQLAELEGSITEERNKIEKLRHDTQSELDNLAAHIGSMQANVTRLNALGQRLVAVSDLDSDEFDFDHEPAYGGPHDTAGAAPSSLDTMLSAIQDELESREVQLSLLEEVIMQSELKKESTPTGRPIRKGWISSYFGKRTDPFSGKLEMHKGMDFAGKDGSDVQAVASGIVTWSGERYGYGNLVEINHGNGYVTRYGHNKEILVQVGDSVEKGETISLMGSTGRSTGPHVHFEVLLNNKQIDPTRFVHSKG